MADAPAGLGCRAVAATEAFTTHYYNTYHPRSAVSISITLAVESAQKTILLVPLSETIGTSRIPKTFDKKGRLSSIAHFSRQRWIALRFVHRVCVFLVCAHPRAPLGGYTRKPAGDPVRPAVRQHIRELAG